MKNREKYEHIFEEIFGVNRNALNEDFNFKTIDTWDSLTHLTLIGELEDAFEVMFETEDIMHFGGFVNGMNILSRYGINFDD